VGVVSNVILGSLVVVNIISTIIAAICELKELEQMHPLMKEIDKFIDDVRMEIEQLAERIKCD